MKRPFTGFVAAFAAAILLTACGGGSAPTATSGELSVDPATLSRDHAAGPLGYDLAKSVPLGGVHNSRWAACQVWYTPVAPEYAIHSMEHGAVWVAYVAMMSDPEVADLVELSAKYPYMLAAPYTELPAPIVATAWGVQIMVNDTKDPRLEEFIKKYAQGPQTPEPGAPCTEGGITSAAEASSVGVAPTDATGTEMPAKEPSDTP
jgi:hypothetical protein